MREPRLGDSKGKNKAFTSKVPDVEQASLKQVVETLWRGRAFRHITLAFCLSVFFGAGMAMWIPAFFMRTHGMGAGELGTWLGLSWGIGGLCSTFLGGFLATRYAPDKESLQMKGVAAVVVLCSVFHGLCFLSSNQTMALIYIALVVGWLIPLLMAPVYSSIQSLVEVRMRAVAVAFISLLSNLIGMGFGPIVVGLLSDMLEPIVGQESLRYALLLLIPVYLWCAWHCWKAADTIEEDIRLIEKKSASVEGDNDALEGHASYQPAMGK